MITARARRILTLSALVATTLATSASSRADDGDRAEVRVRGTCSGSSLSQLRIRTEEGRMRIEFRVNSVRPARVWTVVILRERRIAFRGTLRAAGGRGSIELRRTVVDWPGAETVVVRAEANTGETCRASAIA